MNVNGGQQLGRGASVEVHRGSGAGPGIEPAVGAGLSRPAASAARPHPAPPAVVPAQGTTVLLGWTLLSSLRTASLGSKHSRSVCPVTEGG